MLYFISSQEGLKRFVLSVEAQELHHEPAHRQRWNIILLLISVNNLQLLQSTFVLKLERHRRSALKYKVSNSFRGWTGKNMIFIDIQLLNGKIERRWAIKVIARKVCTRPGMMLSRPS